jgi:cobalt-zinc-cadmium efflux system membrane fusion protein
MKNISIYLILSIFLLGASCKNEQKATEENKAVCVSDSMATRITLDTAKLSNINTQLLLSGEVGFNENKVVKVFPFSSGQILEVKVSLGDKVKAGQILAIIKSADIAGSYSDLKTSNSDLAIAKRQLDNTTSLFEKGISSQKELEEAKENFSKAQTMNQKIHDAIKINGNGNTSSNGTFTIKAPIEGFIVEKKANAGSFIRLDNTDNLFTISDLKDVWVWANVFENDISKVKEGYTAKVKTLAYPDKIFHGKIDKLSEVLSPDNKVMRIRISLPNDALLLKPEMFTNVLIENTELQKAISIPSDAMIFENGKNYVVVYHNKCSLELREVQVMKTENSQSYISSGLNTGDIIISKNQVLFYNAILEHM